MRRKKRWIGYHHPLREQANSLKVPLWELRNALGGYPSEGKLSRMLRGIDPTTGRVEAGIQDYLCMLEFGPEFIATRDAAVKKFLEHEANEVRQAYER